MVNYRRMISTSGSSIFLCALRHAGPAGTGGGGRWEMTDCIVSLGVPVAAETE